MIDSILAQVFSNQWRVIVIVSILLLAVTELGFRFGWRVYRRQDEARKSQIGAIQTVILGLLGLLLGFTYAMAADRFESRRSLVLAEANAIGTTYLRASLLPEATKLAVENLLREYVEARIDFYLVDQDEESQNTARKRIVRLQDALWMHAADTAKSLPSPLTASFISSLNETIDLEATRLHAFRSHVPGLVWLLVLVVAACGCCTNGYSAGTSGARGAFPTIILPVLIAVVITLIADLDRSYGSWIGTDQRPLLDLQATLAANSPGAPD